MKALKLYTKIMQVALLCTFTCFCMIFVAIGVFFVFPVLAVIANTSMVIFTAGCGISAITIVYSSYKITTIPIVEKIHEYEND